MGTYRKDRAEKKVIEIKLGKVLDDLKLTNADLSEKSFEMFGREHGINRNHITTILAGDSSPNLATVLKISMILNMPVNELFSLNLEAMANEKNVRRERFRREAAIELSNALGTPFEEYTKMDFDELREMRKRLGLALELSELTKTDLNQLMGFSHSQLLIIKTKARNALQVSKLYDMAFADVYKLSPKKISEMLTEKLTK